MVKLVYYRAYARPTLRMMKVGESMAMQHYEDDQTDGFIIHIVPELQGRIKKAAAQSNLSVQDYVERILEQTVPPDSNSVVKRDGRLSRAAVDDLLRYREAIRHAHPLIHENI